MADLVVWHAVGYFQQTTKVAIVRRVKLFAIYVQRTSLTQSPGSGLTLLFYFSLPFFSKIKIIQIEQCLQL